MEPLFEFSSTAAQLEMARGITLLHAANYTLAIDMQFSLLWMMTHICYWLHLAIRKTFMSYCKQYFWQH